MHIPIPRMHIPIPALTAYRLNCLPFLHTYFIIPFSALQDQEKNLGVFFRIFCDNVRFSELICNQYLNNVY